MVSDVDLDSRVAELARRWGVTVEQSAVTATSVIVYGHRDSEPVVLKVVMGRYR